MIKDPLPVDITRPIEHASHATILERPGVITVVLHRPEKLNAISHSMLNTIWRALRALQDRDDLRCMVITAEGKYFTAGMDLGQGGAGQRRGNPDSEHLQPGWNYRKNYRDHHLMYDEFEATEKTIIHAAQGICLGGGTEMAASCDFRFCTPNAEYGLPEVNIGLIPASNGADRITRLIGPAWAKWMGMANKRIGAEQAKHIGLVHDVFPAESLLDDVYAFCDEIIALPAETVGLTKIAVDMAVDMDRTNTRHLNRIINTTLHTLDDHIERTARFKKK